MALVGGGGKGITESIREMISAFISPAFNKSDGANDAVHCQR